MYKSSNIILIKETGQNRKYALSLIDTCFSGNFCVPTPSASYPITIPRLEACGVIAEYSRRNLNLSKNIARYYLINRNNRHIHIHDMAYQAYRELVNDLQTINHYVPQVSFLKNHYPIIKYYLNNINTYHKLLK